MEPSRKTTVLVVVSFAVLAGMGMAIGRSEHSQEDPAAQQEASSEQGPTQLAAVGPGQPEPLSPSGQSAAATPAPLSRLQIVQRVGTLTVDAKRALASGDFTTAEAKLDEALQMDPDSRAARALKQRLAEERQEAQVEVLEREVESYHRQGQEALSRSDAQRAIEALRKAQRLDPSNRRTFRLMEKAYALEHTMEFRKRRESFLQSKADGPPTAPQPQGNWANGAAKPAPEVETGASQAPPAEPGEYLVQPEDVLEITVYEEPDLTTKARVSRNGNITFPMLGQVPVSGLTVTQVQERITQLLGQDYLVHPQVQVFVDKPRNVFVTGEVHKPGSYPVSVERPTTVVEILSIAGGFTQDANLNGTRIIRMENGHKRTIPVRVADVIHKGDKSQDKVVQPDDIIFVPESFF